MKIQTAIPFLWLALPLWSVAQDLNDASRFPAEDGSRRIVLSNGMIVEEDRSGMLDAWTHLYGDIYLKEATGLSKGKLPMSGEGTDGYLMLKPFDFDQDGIEEIIIQFGWKKADGTVDRNGSVIYALLETGDYEPLSVLDLSSKIESSAHLFGVRGDGNFYTEGNAFYWEYPSSTKGKTTDVCEIKYDDKKQKFVLRSYSKK